MDHLSFVFSRMIVFGKNFQKILEDLLKNFGKGKWSEVRGGPGSWDFLEKVFEGRRFLENS